MDTSPGPEDAAADSVSDTEFYAALSRMLEADLPEGEERPYPLATPAHRAAYDHAQELVAAARESVRARWRDLVGDLLTHHGVTGPHRLAVFEMCELDESGWARPGAVVLSGDRPGQHRVRLCEDTMTHVAWDMVHQLWRDLRVGELFPDLPVGWTYAVDVDCAVIASWGPLQAVRHDGAPFSPADLSSDRHWGWATSDLLDEAVTDAGPYVPVGHADVAHLAGVLAHRGLEPFTPPSSWWDPNAREGGSDGWLFYDD